MNRQRGLRRPRRGGVGLLIGASLALLAAACVPPPPGGGGTPATLTISPGSASFTATPGLGSDGELFTVTNVGDDTSGPISVLFSSVSGTGAFLLPVNNCSLQELEPDESCDAVVFYENATGTGTASANLVAIASPGGTVAASLGGQGDAGGLELDPASTSLSDTPDTRGTAETFTVTNSTLTPAVVASSIANPAGTGAFAITQTDCTELGPGEFCSVTVGYTNDTGSGSGSATLQVSATPGETVTASLTGEGTDEPLDITPHSGVATDPPNWGGEPVTFTITNNGTEATPPLRATPVNVVNHSGGGWFGVVNNFCHDVSLGPGEHCSLGVEFSALGLTALATGDLEVYAGETTLVASLTGQSVPGGLEVTPASVELTDTPSGSGGTADFLIRNTSVTTTEPLVISIIDATGTGTFSVAQVFPIVPCTTTLMMDGGSQCWVRIRYDNDTGGGSATATLSINGQPLGTFTRGLTGTGLP